MVLIGYDPTHMCQAPASTPVALIAVGRPSLLATLCASLASIARFAPLARFASVLRWLALPAVAKLAPRPAGTVLPGMRLELAPLVVGVLEQVWVWLLAHLLSVVLGVVVLAHGLGLAVDQDHKARGWISASTRTKPVSMLVFTRRGNISSTSRSVKLSGKICV